MAAMRDQSLRFLERRILQAFCSASHQSCGFCSDQPGRGRDDRQGNFGKPHNTLFMIGDYAFERRRPEVDAKIGCGAESHGY